METDGFTLVSRGRKSGKPKTTRTTVLNNCARDSIDIPKVVAKIDSAAAELKSAKFFADISTKLKEVSKECRTIWCFGLGHLGDCITARYQFALLILIKDVLGITSEDIFLCDPIFYPEEVEILEKYNFNVAKENIECMLEVSSPTLLYLPHCPKQLSNNLLFSNWSPNRLQNLVIFCNSFNSIVERSSAKALANNASYIREVKDNDIVQEVNVDNTFKFNDVFNDLALHTFSGVERFDSTFWNANKPEYDCSDTEFIRASE